MVMRPRFSVVIPAFNEEFYLRDCLESLAKQDFAGSFEVIVVDNNSSDRTSEVARCAGADRDRGIRARRLPGAAGRHRDRLRRDHRLGRRRLRLRTGMAVPDRRLVPEQPGRDRRRRAVLLLRRAPVGLRVQKMLFGAVALVQRCKGPVLYITATNFAFKKVGWPGYDTRLAQGGDELDLLRRLRSRGRVAFDMDNPAGTSARRMAKGVVYNFAVSFFYYYILGYALDRAFRTAHHRNGAGVPLSTPGRRVSVRTGRPDVTGVGIAVAAYWTRMSSYSQWLGAFPFRAATRDRVIALTFDDGPNEPFTSEIADFLDGGGRAGDLLSGRPVRGTVPGGHPAAGPRTARRGKPQLFPSPAALPSTGRTATRDRRHPGGAGRNARSGAGAVPPAVAVPVEQPDEDAARSRTAARVGGLLPSAGAVPAVCGTDRHGGPSPGPGRERS